MPVRPSGFLARRCASRPVSSCSLALLSLTLLPGLAKAADAAAPAWRAPPCWFTLGVIAIVLLGALAALARTPYWLKDSTWSLATALSEEVEITLVNPAGMPIRADDSLLAANETPVKVTVMRASSSRLIAFVGMIAILLMFLGFGAFALYAFAETGALPESLVEAGKFLTVGMTLFAPYVVNKFAGMFDTARK